MDNENQPIKNSAFAIRLPLMLSIAFCLGLLLGVNMYKPGGVIPSNKVKRVVKRINDILEYVDEYYVDEVDVETLGNHGIEKILEQLDPHSAFIPAEESELVNAPLKSGFEGIGVEFMIFRDTISVIKAIFDGPSDIAGIRSGDKIVEVEGEAVAGIGIDNRGVIDMLRGEKGTKVEVGIYRRGYDSLMNFVITRNKIPTYSVEVSFMLEDKIGYIKLTRFASSTYEEILKAI